jgi:hypothetical protein
MVVVVGVLGLWVEISAAVGPFEVHSQDSSTVLRLQLAAQLQSVWESRDTGSAGGRDEALSMKARRIRPSMTLTMPRYRTTFRLHLSTAPGSLELMDLYFDSKPSSRFSIRAGQFKIPFTRYRMQSFQRLTFVDWAIVTKYFGAERQMGLALHNGFEKPPQFGFAAGVFSGVNARASHAIGLASVFGESVPNPSDLSGPAQRTEFHPEVAGHVSYNAHGIEVRSDSDPEGGGFRYSLGVSAAWDLDPVEYRDLALRMAPEVLLKYDHVSFMGVGYAGFIEMGNSYRTRRAMTGLLVQTAWFIGPYEISLRYARVDIDDDVADAAFARAQEILAGLERGSLFDQYRNAGMVLAEQEGTLGCNVYLDGHGLKWQTDVGLTRQNRRDEDRTDYLIRSQLQLAF